MPANPWMKTVTLGSLGVAQNLWTVLQAKDPTLKSPECCMLLISSANGNGPALVYIGNSDVSPTNRGAEIQTFQGYGIDAIDLNLIDISQFWVVSDTNSVKLNVSFLVH